MNKLKNIIFQVYLSINYFKIFLKKTKKIYILYILYIFFFFKKKKKILKILIS